MLRVAPFVLAAWLGWPLSSGAVVVWAELADGDLSGDPFDPTVLTFSAGTNEFFAGTIAGDLDYYTFEIAPGFELRSILLTSFISNDNRAFAGIQSGTTFSGTPLTIVVGDLLGYVHTTPVLVGSDILDDMGSGFGAIGFAAPLPAGDYTIWSQQTGPQLLLYGLEFFVAPEPATSLLLALAVAALGITRRAQ